MKRSASALVTFALLFFTTNACLFGQANANVVISQVYGGGGNTSATYINDYVEIYNRTTSSIDISGWAVQYASSTGTSWQVSTVPGSTTLLSGQYFLFQLATGGSVGSALPTPDVSNTLVNMSAVNGKVALTTNNTALSGSFTTGTGPTIVDFVGYGSANGSEGSSAAPIGANNLSITRAFGGLTDSGVNSVDFSSITPVARNSGNFQPVPEPTTILALSAAGFGLVGFARRLRHKA